MIDLFTNQTNHMSQRLNNVPSSQFLSSQSIQRNHSAGQRPLVLLILAIILQSSAVNRSMAQSNELDEPAKSKLEKVVEQPFRIVSYNIKRGLGNDGKTDLKRTAAVLKKLKPDFVGLQEVDKDVRRSGKIDQAAKLARELKMNYIFAPFMDYQGGHYGLAVLSRYPIGNVTVVDLPKGNEPRVALAVEVELPDESKLMLVNLHFDWVEDDTYRFAQATKLKEYLDRLKIPYILLGDFNDGPESRTVKLFEKRIKGSKADKESKKSNDPVAAKKPADDHHTFSATDPKREIDFIFASPKSHWKFGKVDVIDEPLASDHRPVFAELFRRSVPQAAPQ